MLAHCAPDRWHFGARAPVSARQAHVADVRRRSRSPSRCASCWHSAEDAEQLDAGCSARYRKSHPGLRAPLMYPQIDYGSSRGAVRNFALVRLRFELSLQPVVEIGSIGPPSS